MVAEGYILLMVVVVFAAVLLIVGYYGFRYNKDGSKKVSVKG